MLVVLFILFYFISGFIFVPILFTVFVHFLPIVDFISRLNKRA